MKTWKLSLYGTKKLPTEQQQPFKTTQPTPITSTTSEPESKKVYDLKYDLDLVSKKNQALGINNTAMFGKVVPSYPDENRPFPEDEPNHLELDYGEEQSAVAFSSCSKSRADLCLGLSLTLIFITYFHACFYLRTICMLILTLVYHSFATSANYINQILMKLLLKGLFSLTWFMKQLNCLNKMVQVRMNGSYSRIIRPVTSISDCDSYSSRFDLVNNSTQDWYIKQLSDRNECNIHLYRDAVTTTSMGELMFSINQKCTLFHNIIIIDFYRDVDNTILLINVKYYSLIDCRSDFTCDKNIRCSLVHLNRMYRYT